jgi:hypothetical protein
MNVWDEYDNAAKYRTTHADLPAILSPECRTLIDDDPDAFDARVKATAYALAMETINTASENVTLRQLVREAIEIIDADDGSIDIRDWLKAARAALGAPNAQP